ncbi:MAG: hypothetical protein AVDCRST_MAG13-1469, partial [uncultured Solirubrobacteraceae bacterium]
GHHDGRRPLRRRARRRLPRDGRRARLRLARHDDPAPGHGGPPLGRAAHGAAHLPPGRLPLRHRRVQGRHARAPGLVPEPRGEPRDRDPGPRRADPRPHDGGRGRRARAPVEAHDRGLARLRRLSAQDGPPDPDRGARAPL